MAVALTACGGSSTSSATTPSPTATPYVSGLNLDLTLYTATINAKQVILAYQPLPVAPTNLLSRSVSSIDEPNTGRCDKEFSMSQAVNLIVFPVRDVAQAKKLFTKVTGVEPYADQPYYIGFRVGDQEIGLDPNGHKQGLTGPLPYWPVKDIKASLQSLVDAGARVPAAG
jgi:hypothetical protein